jgi:hypothetical protein
LCIEIRCALADVGGVSRTEAAAMVRVVFAKAAEFQTRGVVHFHASQSAHVNDMIWTMHRPRSP